MTTALLVVAVVAAALHCPTLMWWNARRGRAATCCTPRRSSEAETARHEQAALAERIAELQGQGPRDGSKGDTNPVSRRACRPTQVGPHPAARIAEEADGGGDPGFLAGARELPTGPAASASEARDVRLKDVRGVQRVADAFKAA